MTATTKHYAPPIATDHNLWSRHDQAHALAGLEPPTRGDEITRLLAAEPTADALARDLTEGIVTAENAAEWLEDALARIQRAHAADALKQAVGRHREATIRAHADRLTAETAAAVLPTFERTVKALMKAAAKLPAEGDPLDPQAVIALDASREMKAAAEALADLATLAGVHRHQPVPDLPANVARVLPVVEFPEVPAEPVNRMSGNPVDSNAQRDTVRAFIRAADLEGVDRALIGVARGEYPGLTLRLAEDAAELRANGQRARTAVQRVKVDSGQHVHVA